MWTPRRILIFVSTLFAFLVAFAFYFFFFGVYDGLAPLPDRYQPNRGTDPWTNKQYAEPEHVLRLRQAFGNDCEELDLTKRKSQTWMQSKSMVLSVGRMEILKDGRVLLTPFSVGLFGKSKPDQRFPEINTIQCEEAYLTLDRPIVQISDLNKSKLVEVELTGATGIKIVNNRGSFEKHDDLELYIAPGGRLFYQEARNLIWTDDAVQLLDTQTQPFPTKVTGIGMEVLLTKETSTNGPRKAPTPEKKNDGASGVEKITLRSNVDMHLYTDASSGFMTGTEGPVKKAPDARTGTPEKMHVQVTTNGKFVYDMIRDTARFDSPLTQGPLEDRVKVTRNLLFPREPAAAVAASAPKRIDPVPAAVGVFPLVSFANPPIAAPSISPFPSLPPVSSEAPSIVPPKTRQVDDFDVLICDHLDLQFRRKTPVKPAEKAHAVKVEKPSPTSTTPTSPTKNAVAAPDQTNDKEIDFAIATADAPRSVRLKVIADDMDADAVEMRYFAATAESGPRSILKGRPVIAYRQSHRIECPELHLKGSDKDGNGQEGFAKGPGRLDLMDKATGKRTTHIFWKNSLTSIKEREGTLLFDLLTLRGDPVVIDDEKKQDLKAAQYLHLWLEQVKDTSPGAKEGATKQVPHKLLAIERVSLHSPDAIIHNTNQLTVIFVEKSAVASTAPAQPVIAPIASAPPGGPPAQTAHLDKKNGLAQESTQGPNQSPNQRPTLGPPTKNDGAAPEKKKASKPIEITADDVTAFVADSGAKKELSEMICKKEVHIHQEPEVGKEKEKGLDITGSLVELKRAPEGDILHVWDGKKPARLQSGEMLLFGFNVTIDQILNRATVDGPGTLNMPSNKTLDGKPKEGRLNVAWSTQMVFNGSLANFDGNVQATQEGGRMVSQSMQVTLDRPIDFKQGQRGDQKSAVDKIVCDSPTRQVYTEDVEREPDGKLVSYKRLQSQELEVDNKDQRMDAFARGLIGVADYIGRGNEDGPLGKSDDKTNPKTPGAREENAFYLTRIYFADSLTSYVSTVGNGRKTTFRRLIRVYRLPGSDPNIADPTSPVKGSLFMTCDKLDVTSRKVKERVGAKIVEKTYQEMLAHGGDRLVNFETDEFRGNAKTVKFDEQADTIIFEGDGNVPATIYQLPKQQGDRPRTLRGQKLLYNRKTHQFDLERVDVISSWLTPVDPPKLTLHSAPGLFGVTSELTAELRAIPS